MRISRQVSAPGKALITVCVLAIAITLGIGVAAYRVSTPQAAWQPVKSPYPSVQVIASTLRSSLPKHFTYLSSVLPMTQTTVGYQLPNSAFQVILPVSSSSIAFIDTNSGSEKMTYDDLGRAGVLANSYLLGHGFVSVSSQDRKDFLDAAYFYRRSDAICQVVIYTQLSINCSSLPALSAISAQAAPFISLYSSAEPNSGTALVVAPIIRASQTSGYMIANQPIYNDHGKTNVNFYRKGNGPWQMVDLRWYNDPHEDGDITPNCADFESSAQVAAAFAGQSCYDSTTRSSSTVQ